MHLHILGICGTFMGGIARLASEAGHTVTGSDSNIYPPMSTQLEELGVLISDLDDPKQFDQAIDSVAVGNVMSRGKPATEQLLNLGLPYTSGPQWLAEHVLVDRHVLAVAGTHGKTTTASMLAWILEATGHNPGFLIGGVPQNFSQSARLGDGKFFVVEADEYDTAFFDKRSKFVHYRPETLVLNNLEFDHADIFDSLDDIKRQFHHLIRTVPGKGRIVLNGDDSNLQEVLQSGCWTDTETFSTTKRTADWYAAPVEIHYCGSGITWSPPMPGEHNIQNAVAAVAAAGHVGVRPEDAVGALATFEGVARRMQLRAEPAGIRVLDDFAHHPTAIETTLRALNDNSKGRVIAVLEPRSNTMKSDTHVERLADALSAADQVWIFRPQGLQWDPHVITRELRDGHSCGDVKVLAERVSDGARAGDTIVVMSNGGFGGFHDLLIQRLESTHTD